MASRKELEVGQVRELRHPGRSQWRATGPAKVEILALDQVAEIYSHSGDRSPGGYNMHEDMVLVQVLDPRNWQWVNTSSLQTRARPKVRRDPETGQWRRVLAKEGFRNSWNQKWKHELLPDNQYLVKPKLLGKIWDQEEKDRADERARLAAERKARYDAAVKEQYQHLTKIMDQAGVPGTRLYGGTTWHLQNNDLAKLVNHLTDGNVEVAQVHWSDYEDKS
jgi:hypothetical protein